MKKLPHSCFKRVLLPCLTAALVLLAVGTARASTFTMTIQQVGSNVFASGNGTISITGLTFLGSTVLHAQINPQYGGIATGSSSGLASDRYDGASGPSSFGGGGQIIASSATGDAVGIFGGGPFPPPEMNVPELFSGGSLSGTATFDGQSFSSLGITPGTYTWTWDNGANSFVVKIETPKPAAEPGTLLLLGIVLLAGLWLERTRILCRAARC